MNKFSSKTAKETIKNSQTRARMKPGIHTGVILEKLESTETVNGKKFVEFQFANPETNEIAIQRIWFPSDKPYLRDGETEAEATQREVNDALSHIVVILECFVVGKNAEIEANSFEEFCNIAVSRINATKYGEIPLNIKLTFDSNGVYTAFPKFPNYIERSIEGKEIGLFFSKWELENRMTAATITDSKSSGNSSIVKEYSDDLPF